jgi:hypothetical protein
MNNKEISRKTYTEISTLVYEIKSSVNLATVSKIWSLLYSVDLKNNQNYNLAYPPVSISENIKKTTDHFKQIFSNYIFSRIDIRDVQKSLVFFNGTLQSPNSSIFINDDDQNKYIYNSYVNSLENELNKFLNSDQELFLTNNKNSLEQLWGQLIISLNQYRVFFQPFDAISIIVDYTNVQNVLKERNADRTNFSDPAKQNFSDSISLSNRVNVDKPIEYQNENNVNKTWKQLFEEVYGIVLSSVTANQRAFFISNTISSQLNIIINQEYSTYLNKSTYRTNYTFEGSTDKNKFTNLSSNQIKVINTIPESSWRNKTVSYYDSNNRKTISTITQVNADDKIITINSTVGLSSGYSIISFPSIGKGFTIEKDFPESGIIFDRDLNNNDILLFKSTLQKKNTNNAYEDENVKSFYLKNTVFQNNYLSLQQTIFQKKLINISKIKDFDVDFPASGIVFNKTDLNNDTQKKILLVTSQLKYLDPPKYPDIDTTYYFPESVFNTNLFNQEFITSQGNSTNKTYEKQFQT